MEQWERDDLVLNFVTLLSQCDRPIQERMVWHFLLVEDELGLRVGRGSASPPRTSPTWSRWPARTSPTRTATACPGWARTGRVTSPAWR
nr:hypothetical protein GCM10020093_005160 [Planobispora longispora]